MDRGAWWATYSPWGCKELGMTEAAEYSGVHAGGTSSGDLFRCAWLDSTLLLSPSRSQWPQLSLVLIELRT